jgi:hypothetical protein
MRGFATWMGCPWDGDSGAGRGCRDGAEGYLALFWLVGSDTKDEIRGDLEQQDREWGHITRAQKFDVRIITWSRLLDQAERRFNFYRDQLAYNASQEEAVERVRRRHEELLPTGPASSSKGDAA